MVTAESSVADTPSEAAASDSMFTFGGFGTFSAVHSDESRADFTSTRVEGSGAGYSRAWSPAVDSLIAGQASAQFTSQFSALLQVISQQNDDSSFRPHVERANVKYQFTPDLSVHVGRSALDVFLLTDSRNVGFANPWVRTPVELYNLVPLTSSDGLGVSYRFGVAGGTNTLDGSVGHTKFYFPTGNGGTATASAGEQLALVDTYQHGAATLRATYGQAHVTIATYSPLFDAYREFGAAGNSLADRYDVNDRIVLFYGLSAAYEPGDWFLMAECGRTVTHSILGEKTGWYLSSGRRFGKATPYATYGQMTSKINHDPGLDLSTLPPSAAPLAAALNEGLTAAAPVTQQRTFSLGARFDVARSVDLKLQIDRTQFGSDSYGLLINVQPDFRPGGSLTLVTATVDFVF